MGSIIFAFLLLVLFAIIVTLFMGFIPRVFFLSTYIKHSEQTGHE